ncbi:MAG: biotin--[acetyl-CoA-carboxylase] ligase [Candidatus Firestonebacteria bacterium RIFOXYC2_FULL_39_67]|nr:MAG: biotin--[acetyl-CoA-carboxylase] ligase [Candidatus Firestonebacteria bacterium RIFOXYD2_FULL_39_29]OGF56281.1 MAG: biotin--[acetyl-CoA-carboxylase] ligase [Candidatus Firestonebacteria bacterium RIFOXYC2_FULL_39_67]
MNIPDKEEQILILLKSSCPDCISGEELSKKFGVTRAAIWKHMHALMKQGYKIESHTHLGYTLISSPDKVLPAEIRDGLETEYMGRELYCFNEAGSTNEIAIKLAEGKVSEGAVVIAEKQTAGKGRLGRKWISPSGSGLWFSIILKPKINPQHSAKLTFISGLAVLDAIKSVTGLKAGLKWPNDVLVNGKKVCGILTEIKAGPDVINYQVIGIGVNVNLNENAFEGLLKNSATSLSVEAGKEVSRLKLLKEILKNIETGYELFKKEGFEPFLSRWKEHSVTLNNKVKVKGLLESFEGIALDIDDDCALILRLSSGEKKRVLSGDVS